MAWARVQQAVGSGSGVSSLTVAFTAANTVGNAVLVGTALSGQTISSVTDNAATPNTYAVIIDKLVDNESGLAAAQIASTPVTGNLQVKVTASAANYLAVGIAEYSGLADPTLAANHDGTPVGANGANTANASVAMAPNAGASGELAIGVYGDGGTETVPIAGTGWTSVAAKTVASPGQVTLQVEEQSSTAGAADTATFTNAANYWSAVVAVFKLAGGSGSHPAVTATDTLTALSETLTRKVSLGRTLSESLTLFSEATSRVVASARSASEALAGLTETLTRRVSLGRSPSETLTAISDAATRAPQAVARAASDALTLVTETAARAPQAAIRTTSDALVGVTDVAGRAAQAVNRTVGDALAAITDSAATGGLHHVVVTATDTLVGVADVASRSAQAFARSASEALSLSENVIRVAAAGRAVSEALSALSDVAARRIAIGRAAVDAGTLSESVGRAAQQLVRSALDTLTSWVESVAALVVRGGIRPGTLTAGVALAYTLAPSAAPAYSLTQGAVSAFSLAASSNSAFSLTASAAPAVTLTASVWPI